MQLLIVALHPVYIVKYNFALNNIGSSVDLALVYNLDLPPPYYYVVLVSSEGGGVADDIIR